RNCGQYADDIQRVTLLINGGYNGIDDRKARFETARRALL
ncbi:Endolysin, partial [Yersinia ruckeri]